MTLRAGGRDSPADRAAGPRRPGSRAPRVAFAISAVVHGLLLLLYADFASQLRPEDATLPLPSAGDPAGGLAVLRIVEIDEVEAAERVEEPEEVEAPTLDPGPFVFPDGSDRPLGLELLPPPASVAERLRPNLTDPRLWAPDPAFGRIPPALIEQLAVAGRLEEWYDAVRLAAAADSALTDWTFTDADGKRWGIANGRIYLGDSSLPLPFDFGVNPWARQQVNDRLYEWEEITRQGRTMEIRDGWRARAEAIRERRDRERAQADTARGPGS